MAYKVSNRCMSFFKDISETKNKIHRCHLYSEGGGIWQIWRLPKKYIVQMKYK